MTSSNKPKLFIMMVLEFFIWGAWLPLIYNYLIGLGFSLKEQWWVLNAFPIAAIIGMFFSNQWADRKFAAEKFMAVSHLISGLAILGCGFVQTFWPFFLLMLIHCLLYVPTLSIANSIAFAHVKDPQRDFGVVRVGGTIGWILAAWPFTFILVDWDRVNAANPEGLVSWLGTVLGAGLTGAELQRATRWTYIVAGIASLILAGFSLTLPHTPPRKAGQGGVEKLAWLEAFKLLKAPFVLVLWIVAFVDAFILYSYFNWTGIFLGSERVGIPGNWIMPVMSISQVAEIVTMLILGMTLKALGWRLTMIIGILGHALRFAIYAFFPEEAWLIVVIQIVHGICYAFFFATVYIFVDTYFPKDIRSSAQGLFNFMILGVGSIAANVICPWLLQSVFTGPDGVVNFRGLFLVPTALAILTALALALFFHPPKQPPAEAGASAPPAH